MRFFYHNCAHKRGNKGVSDIVGNILILAITVTLFSTLFYWVGTLPSPTPSVSTQFTASIITTGSQISEITITDLGGSPLYNASTIIYISYQMSPQYNREYYVSSGLSGTSNYNGVWLPGMIWSVSTNVPASVNGQPQVVTISIIDSSKNQLVWNNQYPISNANLPPQITSEGTLPNQPILWGEEFQVWARISELQTGVTIKSVVLSIPFFGISNLNMPFDNNQLFNISPVISSYNPYTQNVSAWITATNSNSQSTTVTFIIQFYTYPSANVYVSQLYMYPRSGNSQPPFGGYGDSSNSVSLYLANSGLGPAFNIHIIIQYQSYATNHYEEWLLTELGWQSVCVTQFQMFNNGQIYSTSIPYMAPQSGGTYVFNWNPYPTGEGGWYNAFNYWQVTITFQSQSELQSGTYTSYIWQYNYVMVAYGPGNSC
jgi:FlaG/FlaF family flagellin (archaellin)